MSTGCYSREALVAQIGEAMVAEAERAALEAPDPGPETVEEIRRIFAPSVLKLTEAQAAQRESVPA